MRLLAQEIENLRREAQAFKSVRAALRSKDSGSDAAKMVFQKVQFFLYPVRNGNLMSYVQIFHNDILNLLSMEDMWQFRDKPVPLDFDLIQSDQFVLHGQAISDVDPTVDGILHPVNGESGVDRRLNGRTASLNGIRPRKGLHRSPVKA